MARRRRTPKDPGFSPFIGDYAYAEGAGNWDAGKWYKVRVVDLMRSDGVNMATIRFLDKEHTRLPTGGLAAVKIRDLRAEPPEPVEEDSEERVVAQPKNNRRTPTYFVTNTVNTSLNSRYDFGVHAYGCRDVARDKARYGVDVYPHYEATPEAVIAAEIDDLEGGGFDREAAESFEFKVFACCKPQTPARTGKSGKTRRFAGRKKVAQKPLQSEPASGTVPKARPTRGRAKPSSSTNQRRTKMARRTAASTKEAPAKTSGRGRRKAAPEPEPENGGRTRMSHEDKLKLVPEIVKRLKGGETFSEIRQDPDMPSSGLRKALFEKGYDTKGNRIEQDEDLSEMEGKALSKAVVAMREEGTPWYRISLAADMSEAELKEIISDAGRDDLLGRVSKANGEEEVEEAPKPRGRKRSSAKAAVAEEEKPKPTRRRGRSRRANPSDED